MNAYKAALLDWLACAYAGRAQRAARAAEREGLLETVTWLATAGHVLDFDDTYLPGIAHLSAPTAPVAVVMAARLQASIGDALEAYAAGFEAMGALSRSHRLYASGWHPTAVCGAAGAAVTTVRLLGPDEETGVTAMRLALLQAGGLRAAFGSDGKSLQVGMAAAAGVQAAHMAIGGAVIAPNVIDAPDGFAAAFGDRIEDDGHTAIDENWIKPWPCCLMSHSAIEATTQADVRRAGAIEVVVHPVARRAAAYNKVEDGLQAKFSIPYLVAFVALRGEPEPASFDGVDDEVRAFAREHVHVRTDDTLGETEAVLVADGHEVARVAASLGSPQRPMTPEQLAAKCHMLAGDALDGILDDLDAPAQTLLNALSTA
ncbi:MAG TPA: MmgE/PrpD family protein [Solirubrobacteraceae bacterium]|nr:MmgE/PrpD family protein [Solirubrobacteraceae bacterium]